MSYSKEQLMTALRNADKAGDTEGARRIAGMINSYQPEQQAQPERESKLSDIFTGADRETDQSVSSPELDEGKLQLLAAGLDPNTPISELLSSQDKREELQRSHKSKLMSGDFSGFFKDALGQFVTPFTTDDKETADISKGRFDNLQRIKDEKGNEYLVNSDSGYSIIVNKPGFSTRDAVNLGANTAAFATGGVASSIPRAIAKDALIQSGIEAAQSGAGGEFNPEEVALAGTLGGAGKGIENALGAAFRGTKGKMSEEAASNIANMESRGLKARTEDLIAPETLPGKMAAGVGEMNPLTAGQQVRQQAARQQAADSYVEKFAPSYDEIKASLTGKKKKINQAAINSMDNAISQAKGAELSKKNTINAIESELTRLTELPSGEARKVIDESSVNTLSDYLADVKAAGNIEDLRDLRTTFRDDIAPKFGEKSNRKDAAMKRVYGSMTKDMDETVKSAVTPREFIQYKRGNAVYGREAEKLKKGRIKKVLQAGDDLSPEQIDRNLLSKDSVIRGQLFSSLDSEGRDNARAAIVRKLADDATKGGELSVNQFLTNLTKNEKALNTFFRGRDRKELEGLRNALEATRSAQNAAVNPPTGQRLAPFLLGGSAIADLGSTVAATLGSAAAYRAYQSKPVRNALLKLANTPKGSTQFEKSLRTLNEALLPYAQASTSTE